MFKLSNPIIVHSVLTDNENGERKKNACSAYVQIRGSLANVLKEAGHLCFVLWDVESLVCLSSGIVLMG